MTFSSIYSHIPYWLERFQRVLSVWKKGDITEENLKNFQLFLLDTGQFNANFDLAELDYLHYPKSPFAIMHEKFYLREVETWAMEMLRFQYQEEYADFGQSFPIFVDSNLFWKELERYHRVIKTPDVSDDSVLGVLDAVKANNKISVWIEVDKPDEESDANVRKELARKEVEQKLVELTLIKQNIPNILIPIFVAIYNEEPIIVGESESVVLERLDQFAPQVRENVQMRFEDLVTKLNAAVLDPAELEKSISLIFRQCRKYKMLPLNVKTLQKFKKFSSESPEAIKQLTVELIRALRPQELTADSYSDVIEVWNQQNIPTLPDEVVYYFRDKFHGVETVVLCAEEEEPDFVHKAIEHLGYRIDPVKIQHVILRSYPSLFVNAEETGRFWEEFSKISMLTELNSDEQEVMKQLQQTVLEQIQNLDWEISTTSFSLEMQKLDGGLFLGGFNLYARYLKHYLEDYLERYQPDHTLRLAVDAEIKKTLNVFLQACEEENLSTAIRAVQSISEIMLLDFNHNPLQLSSQLPAMMQIQLSDLPVQGTLVVPYGMRAFVRVFQILDAKYKPGHFHERLNIFVTSQSYFEWLDSLENLKKDQISVFQAQQRTDIGPIADVIFVELHPNNVLAPKQFAFDIYDFLHQIRDWEHKQRTLVIDATLNAVHDREVQNFLHSELALDLIASGELNIILIQSLTKFAQLGLDKRSAGLLTMTNSNDYWSAVNTKLHELQDIEQIDLSTMSFFSYFANMHWPEIEYLKLINKNVRFVYQEVTDQTNKLELLHSGFQVGRSSDPKPCYVAINTNGFITDFSLTPYHFQGFISDILLNFFYPLCKFYGLPITERYSIGFPLSSVNPVEGSLRFTIGLEPDAQLKQYAEILAYITFSFNDLRKEQKLPLVQDEELRREFIGNKVQIFKAMTPGRDKRCEWEYEGDGHQSRKVVLENGNIKFFREAPSLFAPHDPEWSELLPTVIVRGIGEVSVNNEQITIAEKRIVAGCYTAEYKPTIDNFQKTVCIQNYEVLGLWNAKFLYGPFYYENSKLFCALHQKRMEFYYNGQRFLEGDVIVKQGTIETTLSDMAIEDREFFIREAYYSNADRSIPSVFGHNKFSFAMQFIPPRDQQSMRFCLKEDKLIVEHDFLCCNAPGATVYYRVLGEQHTCYEVNYWDEKDPIVARFLGFITAAYVKDVLSEAGFKARNPQFTHFLFNLNYEEGNVFFQEAIDTIVFSKESIKEALQSITLDEQQYHLCASSQVCWPSSALGIDSIYNNAAFIARVLEQLKNVKFTVIQDIQLAITDYEEQRASVPLSIHREGGGFGDFMQAKGILNDICNLLKRINDDIEKYVNKFFAVNKYGKIQKLADKYNIGIKVIDEDTLKSAYRKIALQTHPDKVKTEETKKDFLLAKELLDQGEDSLVKDVYALRMKQIQNINIGIKVIDTLIDAGRATYEPTPVNKIKVAIGIVQLTALYMGKTGVALPVSIMGGLYQAYEGNWEGAVKTVVFGVGITIMYSALPAIALPLSAAFTVYSVWSTFNNGYELYNELYLEDVSTADSTLIYG